MAKNTKKKKSYPPQALSPNINHLKELYLQAQQLQQQGYLSRAETLYQEILRQMPDQPDALHYLGLIYMNKGDMKLAEDHIKRSIKSSGNPIYYSNYGLLLTQQGKLGLAVEQYKKAVELQPVYAEAWYNLGATLSELGQHPDAEEAYKKAITCRKDYIKAMYGLACVQEAQGKSDEANSTVEKIKTINPDTANTYYTLGLAFQYLGGSRNIRMAHDYLQKALELSPESLEIYYALARLFEEGNNIDSALDAYREILSIEPDYQDVRNRYAHCLIKDNQVDEAEEEVIKIINNNPENITSQAILAKIYTTNGKFTEANEIYRKILELNQYYNRALAGLASNRKITDKNDELIQSLYESVSRKKSALSYFALGKIHNDLGEYDQAFDAYRKANDLKNKNTDFKTEEHAAYIDSIINKFSKELVKKMQEYGNDCELPVFIIGTPRSGTTLTEQIMSSHPRIAGAGELTYISKLAKNRLQDSLTPEKYPERIADITSDKIQEESSIYLDKIKNHQNNSGIIRVTDKMPGNFFYLGYISILFPKARIIHCRRHPLDSCLSIYFQLFQAGHQYSFNLDNLGHWYKDYLRLMEHWKVLFGDNILDVDYDETVNNTETIAKRLIQFCGLEWDEKCLEFHKQEREIHTASQWQVRQPIYKTSLDRWKRYDKHIGELKEILAGHY